MRIFRHSTLYTRDTLVPGIMITESKYNARPGDRHRILKIGEEELFCLTLEPLDTKIEGYQNWDMYHRLYTEDGKSFWEEIKDLI